MSEIQSEINQLRLEKARLFSGYLEAANVLEAKVDALEEKKFRERWGWGVGDVVRVPGRRHPFLVTRVHPTPVFGRRFAGGEAAGNETPVNVALAEKVEERS